MNTVRNSPSRTLDPIRADAESREVDINRRKTKHYSRELKDLARFLWERGKTLASATEKDAAAWILSLKRRGTLRKRSLTEPAILRRIAGARGFFEQVRRWTDRNPFARFKTRRSDRSSNSVSRQNGLLLKRMASSIDPESPWGLRNRAILFLRFGTPLRILEICQLKRSDVFLGGHSPWIRVVRNRRLVLRFPIRGRVLQALRRYVKQRRLKGTYLFGAIPGVRKARPLPLSSGWVSSMIAMTRSRPVMEGARRPVKGRRRNAQQ